MIKPNSLDIPVYQARLSGLESIEASAGTGKTWTITGLVVRALVRGLRIDQILVITFTNPAAAELRVRIAGRIAQCIEVLLGTREASDQFEGMLEAWFDKEGIDLELALNRLKLAQANIDTMSVQTIHAFSQQTLQTYALSAGQGPELELRADAQAIIDQQVQRYLSSLQEHPNATDFATRFAWASLSSKALGANFKKALSQPHRSTNPQRVDWLQWFQAQRAAADGFRHHWLVLGQACKALGGMLEDLVVYLFGHHARSPQHYKSWFAQLERVVHSKNSLACLDEDELGSGFKYLKLLAEQGTEKEGGKKAKPLFPGGFESIVPQLRAMLVAIEGISIALPREANFERLLALDFRLQKADDVANSKRKSRIQTFDDLMDQMAHFMVSDNSFARRCAETFPLILVDESQDNNAQQWEIFLGIHYAVEEGHGLMVVGDPKQAIYRFRGADLAAYFDVTKKADFSYQLLENQRSTHGVIEATNALFSGDKAFQSEQIDFHASRRGSKPALKAYSVEHNTVHEAHHGIEFLDLGAIGSPTEWFKLNAPKLDAELARITAADIATVLNHKSLRLGTQGHESAQTIKASDIAVLVTNNKQAARIKSALLSMGIACSVRQRDSVFDEIEADWLGWICHGIASPDSQEACKLVAGIALFGATHEQLKTQLRGADSPWLLALQQDLRTAKQLWERKGLLPAFEYLRRTYAWPAKLGYLVNYSLLRQASAKRHLANVNLILDLACAQEPPLESAKAMIAWLSHAKQANAEGAEPYLSESGDLVQIATVHASKGLEYPIVYLPYVCRVKPNTKSKGMEFHVRQGVMQFGESLDEKKYRQDCEKLETEQEQLRLFYVALTRAQTRCVIPMVPNAAFKTSPLPNLLGLGTLPVSEFGTFIQACANLPYCEVRKVDPVFASMVVQRPNTEANGSPGIWRENSPRSGTRPVWLTSSFSWISSHTVEQERERASGSITDDTDSIADHDAITLAIDLPNTEPQALLLEIEHRLPSSALMGQALHRVFELGQWTNTIEASFVAEVFESFGLEHLQEASNIAQWIDSIRTKEFQFSAHSKSSKAPAAVSKCFQLSKLKQSLREIKFELSVNQNVHGGFTKNLAQLGLIPNDIVLANIPPGFLRGVMDAVVLIDGRFYVLDWKSNRLGNRTQAYSHDALHDSMLSSLYRLQAWIYVVALDAFLANRIPSYSPQEHLGGALYFYIRGHHHPDTQGLYVEPFYPNLLALFKEALR